ncbi:MAG: DNA polymerase IV [Phycisphaerae bacterium]
MTDNHVDTLADHPRVIGHVDMDAFYAAIEQRDNPELAGKPVLVGGSPDGRGVVSTASYEARPFGCRSAMPMAQAIRLCPHAVVVRTRMERYVDVSREVFDVLHQFTPVIEGLSIDEAFLDLTASQRLHGPPETMATKIREAIFNRVGLTCSVGMAPNKFIAKLASEANKPDGQVIIRRGEIRDFLDPLPIGNMWGIGRVGEERMKRSGIHTFLDLRTTPMPTLVARFGEHAEKLQRLAMGLDDRPVAVERDVKSISHETTFARDVADAEHLRSVVLDFAEQTAARLRSKKLLATTVNVKLRTPDFRTYSRQKTLPHPTNATAPIQSCALQLFDAWLQPGHRPLRLIGVGLTGLSLASEVQLDLFEDGEDLQLDTTLDEIRLKFGKAAIKRGTTTRPSRD